ncbi:AraC family transcriptional regulator [Achromobacter insolitus]|uniref:AraC family transcriptional regulator n=1 Tax=Achromobacter insolitus TaxID=217204 RepID=UPI000972A710|nr:helix-turn-helix transcriptional regulator [Achromobacter insolitus]APX73798.1 AraC family transcriptional regulator [Achromobacter insolitus]OWT54652.1 AraC family transcriptional regulator [Achromobacter insolitus]CAB3733130.1 HTH-type transcriptional regulator NimR [Achromobacter insolitus]VEG69606.1 HTH-type transcriptional repressor of iron proteins A [Achromobacter insolitus]
MPARLLLPDPARSINPQDYQHRPRVVTAMAKEFPPGTRTGTHSHPRAQLVYAVEGIMRVTTPSGFWALPPLRALWVPAGVPHGVDMVGAVSMRSLYLEAETARDYWPQCQVVEVSGLLRELILALTAEPIDYPLGGRAEQIAALLLSELAAAHVAPLQIPWPRDRRLQTICAAILDAPGLQRGIEDWGSEVGASARTLIRLFQAELGLNYRQWVQQVRLAEAVCRLSQGAPVARIASDLGYRSTSAFSAMFHRALGAPPQHYLRPAAAG